VIFSRAAEPRLPSPGNYSYNDPRGMCPECEGIGQVAAMDTVVSLSLGEDENLALRVLIALVAAAIIVGAVVFSKRKSIAVAEEKAEAGLRQI
jgi:excinuclease UvrABC ATPase subunit